MKDLISMIDFPSKGLHMIIREGWPKLVYFIYHLSLLVYLGL